MHNGQPTYQKHTFSTGGFVIHAIPWQSGKVSAWYEPDGTLSDCQQFDRNGKECRVSAGAMRYARGLGPLWASGRR